MTILNCIAARFEARQIKRWLVTSLLTDPDWKLTKHEGNRASFVLKGKEIEIEDCYGLRVFYKKTEVWFPIFARCCIKKALRRRLYKEMRAELGTSKTHEKRGE